MTDLINGQPVKRDVKLIPCACYDISHHIIVERTDYPGEAPEYSVSVTLSCHESFLSRIWLAVKYVFRRDANSYYHDILLTEEQFKNISKLFESDNEKDGKPTAEVEKA